MERHLNKTCIKITSEVRNTTSLILTYSSSLMTSMMEPRSERQQPFPKLNGTTLVCLAEEPPQVDMRTANIQGFLSPLQISKHFTFLTELLLLQHMAYMLLHCCITMILYPLSILIPVPSPSLVVLPLAYAFLKIILVSTQ